MNIEVVPKKLLILSSLISSIILLSIYIYSSLNHSTKLSVCNTESKINLLIQSGTFDILINPIGKNQTLDCLGKYLPYFDRSLDVVVSSDNTLVKELEKRYTVDQIIESDRATFGNLTIRLTNKVIINNGVNLLFIYQRPLKQLDTDLLEYNDFILIKPQADDIFGSILRNKIKNIVVLKEGSLLKLPL